MFEAIATGCLPVVLAPHAALSVDLPFPSLLSYDDFAYFSHSFDFLGTRTQGVSRLAGKLHIGGLGCGFRVICISMLGVWGLASRVICTLGLRVKGYGFRVICISMFRV